MIKTDIEIIQEAMLDLMNKNVIKMTEIPLKYNVDEKFITVSDLLNAIEEIKNRIDDNNRLKEEHKKATTPIKKFLFVEDGSVDFDDIQDTLDLSNPEIKVIVYRQGSVKPILEKL